MSGINRREDWIDHIRASNEEERESTFNQLIEIMEKGVNKEQALLGNKIYRESVNLVKREKREAFVDRLYTALKTIEERKWDGKELEAINSTINIMKAINGEEYEKACDILKEMVKKCFSTTADRYYIEQVKEYFNDGEKMRKFEPFWRARYYEYDPDVY